MGPLSSLLAAIVNPIAVFLVVLAVFLLKYLQYRGVPEPPCLPEAIPFVSNAYQSLTDVAAFLERVKKLLNQTGSNIAKFKIGPKNVYIITGAKNVQKVFGSPNTLDGNFLQLAIMKPIWALSREELARFANDKTGRLKTPAPEAEGTPASERYWFGHTDLYVKYLTPMESSDALAERFYRLFTKRLYKEAPADNWITVQLFDLLKNTMVESATISLFGSRIIDMNPGFVKCYWEFDEIAATLIWGLPKWLRPDPYRRHERLLQMTIKHIESAWERFDWDGPEADTSWDPHFGCRLSRETAKWMREKGFSNRAAAGHVLSTIFGLNGNTVPICTWALIELVRDPSLLQAVRGEVSNSYAIDPETGEIRLDPHKLIEGPLLQAVYIEVMRIHISLNVTREVLQPITIGQYHIAKGSIVQTVSQIAHFEDSVWSVEGHPASEFWPWRHIKNVETEDKTEAGKTRREFFMRGRPSSFFPYGGAPVLCPGRHFAKQEILLAIAVIISKFDIDILEWTQLDGTSSERPAQNDNRFAGVIAMPPDRDIKVRLKRR